MLVVVKEFNLIMVDLLEIIKFFWCKLMKVIKRLILVEMVNFRLDGIVLMMILCSLKIVIKIKMIEVIKILVKVVC